MPRSARSRDGRTGNKLRHPRSLPHVNSADLVTRPVGPDDLPDLATLFGGNRNTRHCWCTAFCSTRSQFAAGWLTGRNQHRFESMARGNKTPMGILAPSSGEPVGWCACGPRSRYAVADSGRGKILRDRDRREDKDVWLLACMFVRTDYRAQGVTYALVRAATELARREGALAIEGWPVTGSDRNADAFVGREKAFADLGFHRVARPTPQRSIMRLQLHGT
jgi:GNAT superfamily N-acetyltransferase